MGPGICVFLVVLVSTRAAGCAVLFRISDAEFLSPIPSLVRICEALLPESHRSDCVAFGLQRRRCSVFSRRRSSHKDRVRSHSCLFSPPVFSMICQRDFSCKYLEM